MQEEKLLKWRLVLGRQADESGAVALPKKHTGMDKALEMLYDGAHRQRGLGNTAPTINRWLQDIRSYFPSPVVQLLQKDALERLHLKRMLLEPELLDAIVPDVHLASVILSLNKILPEKTRASARSLVRQIVEDLEKQLRYPMEQAIRGSLNRAVKNFRPKSNEIDWNRTIRANLKHYQPELKSIIPEKQIGFGKKQRQLHHVILLIDQSGSMATSVVYAAVFGAILASLSAVRTHIVVFDTSVVDLSGLSDDPVELLFATQLGGGTHIGQALSYAQSLVAQPQETILVLISDLYEGGNEANMREKAAALKQSGIEFICLLALNDEGAPAYDRSNATFFAQLDIPSFACTPLLFPSLMANIIQKQDLNDWLASNGIALK